jgi:hypothetical protein
MLQSAVELGRRQHLSAAELLEHGLRLRPGLVTRQEEAERLRRLAEATMQEFHDAGILRVIQPAAFGGFEADFICQIDLTYEIARVRRQRLGLRGAQCARRDDREFLRARTAGGLGRRMRARSPPVRCRRSAASSALTAAASSAAFGATRVVAITEPTSSPERTPRSPTKPVAARPPLFAADRSTRHRRRLAGARPCRHRQQIAAWPRRVCA